MADASKYAPLTRHLQARAADVVAMKFAEVERVIGAKLPPSAHRNRAYWSNNAANSVLTRAWLAAGFRSEQVDLAGARLVFRRTTPARHAAASGFAEAPATPFLPQEVAMSDASTPASSLFGCMEGTLVVHGDLTEPADPDLVAYLEDVYGPAA